MTSENTRNYTTELEESIIGNITADNVLNMLSVDEKKSYVVNLLRNTNRDGIENVLSVLEHSDYYTAPSSTKYHSNYEHGLLDHSLLVLGTAFKLRRTMLDMDPTLCDKIPVDSLIICCLLHDVCKCGFYKPAINYKKDENNQWISYNGFVINDTFPIGHGEKSVIMLQKFGLDLNPNEMIAIRWHMGSWDGSLLNDTKTAYLHALDNSPLLAIVQNSDSISSLLLEKIIEH